MTMRTWILPIVMTLFTASAVSPVVVRAASETKPRLTGTFLQIDSGIASWSEATWAQELDSMHSLGMDLIILQYAGYGNAWWYPRPGGPAAPDLVGRLLKLAGERGMQVHIGLHLDPGFWNEGHDYEADLQLNLAVANELHQLYGSHEAFTGWYIPHELSDLAFAQPALFAAAIGIGSHLVSHLKDLTPNKPIGIAPYYGRYLYPKEYQDKWSEFLDQVPVDIIMLQDGVGTHRVGIADIAPYYRALLTAIGDRPIQLWSDVEIFDQIHGWPVDDRGWAAIPASVDRIVSQMEAAAPYVGRFVAFEFSHYMSPRLSQARQLFEAYGSYLEE